MKCTAVWHGREAIPSERFNLALARVFDGTNCPQLTQLTDPEWDQTTYIVSSGPITADETGRAWQELLGMYGETDRDEDDFVVTLGPD